MTREPDIIREAERVVEAMETRTYQRTHGHDGCTITVAGAGTFSPTGDWRDVTGTLHTTSLLAGIDNPEPTVRVSADEQRDYGDEHKERA